MAAHMCPAGCGSARVLDLCVEHAGPSGPEVCALLACGHLVAADGLVLGRDEVPPADPLAYDSGPYDGGPGNHP